jgi:hypothetical protein
LQLQQLELELKNQSATERSSYEKQYRTRRQAVDGFVKQLSQLAYGYGTIDTGGVVCSSFHRTFVTIANTVKGRLSCKKGFQTR